MDFRNSLDSSRVIQLERESMGHWLRHTQKINAKDAKVSMGLALETLRVLLAE